MNKLSTEKRIQVVAALVEGNSIRATVRMTGVAKNTIVRLLAELGEVCWRYQDRTLVDLPCKRIQADEIWSFCYAKQKNVPADKRGEPGVGDVWTWAAIDADTKLVASWVVGQRDSQHAVVFMSDLASRLHNQVQLTTDAFPAYLRAVWDAFGCDVDYATLQKQYGNDPTSEKRYSPAICTGIDIRVRQGEPDSKHISTSYVERQNLTMRMSMRRFTRLTNGFSKKIENHDASVSLHFMHYNFARPHKTLKGDTPAMAAGVSDHVWSIGEIVALLDDKSLTSN